jgi:hypothetical protein
LHSASPRAVLAADDPYPPLQVTPLDGASVIDPRLIIPPRSPRAAASKQYPCRRSDPA